METHIASLKKILSAEQVKSDVENLVIYAKDWTTYYTPDASCVCFPKTTEEVQLIVRYAYDNELKIVPSGGRTGLSGGAVAENKEIILSLEKMNKILDFQEVEASVKVQAGVITEDLQNFAEEKSYYFPVDFAARGSSQIGGNIATNAGGIKVVKYGLMRQWVSSITVVTGKAEILHLNNSLEKNATGYDFRHLFIGSEGTLGIITEAEIKLTTRPKESQVLLLGVKGLADVMKLFKEFKTKTQLLAFEFFSDLALKYVRKSTGFSQPMENEYPFYALVELELTDSEQEEKVLNCFEYCMEQSWIQDGVMSQSPEQAKELWRYREDITESIAGFSPYKNDIAVRISFVPEFVESLSRIYKESYPDFEVVWFGHIGDGNLHISILKPEAMSTEKFVNKCKSSDQLLFAKVKEFQGSVSAEHGVGLLKKNFLNYTRTENEIKYMQQIKKIFDPKNILNPDKIF